MSSKRIKEKSQEIRKSLREGTAFATVDASGRRHIRKLNTDKKTVRRSILGTRIFYNCPKCGQLLTYKKKMHQGLCMNCGQGLNWGEYGQMPAVYLSVRDADEAGYWAGQYEKEAGTLYGIDFESWRLSMTRKVYPMLLYFPFADEKAYGRFMRRAAKEATIIKEFGN